MAPDGALVRLAAKAASKRELRIKGKCMIREEKYTAWEK
jgi:hypothetical protein